MDVAAHKPKKKTIVKLNPEYLFSDGEFCGPVVVPVPTPVDSVATVVESFRKTDI